MNIFTRKQKDGKSYIYVDFTFNNKRVRKSLDLENTAKNRKLVKNKILPELQHKLNSGMFIENETIKTPLLGEYKKVSFEVHKIDRRDLTQEDYERIYRLHIEPHFSSVALDKIKSSDLAIWQNRLLEDKAPKTVKVIRTVFSTILEDAMCDEIIKTNPFIRVKAPVQHELKEKKPFSQKEMFDIIENMQPKMKCFFAIGFFSGLRTGELIGLRWEDIDLDNRIIKIKRSRRRGQETLPKTKYSIRDVDILDVLVPYIQEHIKIVESSSIYLFETYFGNPYNTCDKISSHYWKKLLIKLNIEHRNIYQMRHSFASLMISNGEDILWVSKMLGHKDSSTTLEKYARFVKTDDGTKNRASFLLENVA